MSSLCQTRALRRCVAIYCCAAFSICALAQRTSPHPDAWQSALQARLAFEAEPAGTHTQTEYKSVLDGFRAIYHASPGDAHAARAVEQVAELLAEQGREFHDRTLLRAAAGQYEFLVQAYPGDSLAPVALGQALDLLGPDAAADSAEAIKVRAELENDYPHSSAARAARSEIAASTPQQRDNSLLKQVADTQPPFTSTHSEQPLALVTGIRHWSTPNYTRVVVDLGGEVQYQAARVEDPDRIFFDLHHSRLADELVGRSFTVPGDGLLTRIRAAQFSGDVTRIVLDIHDVGEYSAFLLPNPYRLIIDIHGKRNQAASAPDPTYAAPLPQDDPPSPAPTGSATEISSLPPMPVTDGSSSFGLPARSVPDQTSFRTSGHAATASTVPRPRVVISSTSTPSRPVPNTVTTRAADTGVEVADVSDQPGMVEATRRPTSRPIVANTSDGYIGRSASSRHSRNSRATAHVAGTPAIAAPPTADGETSLVRALGLKIGRIVIDAGHGGHDSGTLGAGGIEEKDVVLDVALRLGKLLHDRLGAEIVYTRADDTFIPLETRTAIANKAQADLFISIHANSSSDPTVRGVEVYYLNFTSDPDAMRVAARENAVSSESVYELSDLVKKIALKDKIDESRELAADVDAGLYGGLEKGNPGMKNRGVKKAPFVVLIGANMPSILAEISFVTNPTSASELERPAYRERVAESLYNGVARYAEGINGANPDSTSPSNPRVERAAR